MTRHFHPHCKARHIFAAALALGICLLSCAPAARAAPLIVDYPDYWPFFTRQDDGRMTGFFYDIVTQALGRMGIESEWRVFPWSRCQANVEKGDADAFVTVPTEERLRYTATHETPFYQKKLVVFTYAGHPMMQAIQTLRGIDDIRRLNLTVVTYLGNGWNDEHIQSQGIKTFTVSNLPNVWLMLAGRRGDIVIEWPFSAWPDISRSGTTDRIVQTEVALEAMPFHLMIRKDCAHAARLPEFDAVIREMLADGRIEHIVAQYTR